MRYSKILSVASLVAALFAGSCKKDPPTAIDKVIGSWQLTSYAIDSNKNGILEANEVKTDLNQFNTQLTFYSYGRFWQVHSELYVDYYGNPHAGSYATYGIWAVLKNNTYMQLYDTTTTSGAVFSRKIDRIERLTDSVMTLKDTMYMPYYGNYSYQYDTFILYQTFRKS